MTLHRFKLPRVLAISVLLSCVTGARAAPTQPPPALTLDHAVRLVLERGTVADEIAAGLRSVDADIAIARLRPNPTLDIEAENIDGGGVYSDGALRETTYALAMPLELGGKRAARGRVAEAERIAALAGADSTRAEAVLQLTELFVEAVASERRADLAQSRTTLASASRNAAQARIRAGKASPLEEQRAEVVRLNAEVAAGRAAREAQLARTVLARLTGVPESVPLTAAWFDATDAPAVIGDFTPPSLAQANAAIAAADARVDAARRERMPNITLSAGVRRFAEVNDSAAMVALSVPIPVLDTGRAAVARAQAELDRAEARKRSVALDQQRAEDAARVEIENARAAALAANGPALAAAEEAARIARLGYEAGKFSQLESIEAERVLADTREAAVDALQALHVARARLYRLDGRVDPIAKD